MSKLSAWLNRKPYTKAMYVTAIASVIMATVSIAMVYALYQNQQVIELGVKSFNMQKADFQLRNRPWLSVVGIQISGPEQNQSGHFPHFVSIQIKNIGSLPAILSKGIYRCILDDKEITNNQTALLSIASNQITMNQLGLTEDLYNKIMSGSHRFEVTADITYADPLDNESNTFQVEYRSIYYQSQGKFAVTKTVFSETKPTKVVNP
jgi:archaellum component FlaG (FlaF/FlaG flagellin family)